MGIVQEFKEFAVKGNVIDLAVGVIIGAAFGKIVTSLVNDIIMPPFGYIMGGVDFSNLSIVLRKASENSEAVAINYGLFLNTIIEFVVIAFVIFMVIKQVNRLNRTIEEEQTKTPPPPEDVTLLREIRDLLKR